MSKRKQARLAVAAIVLLSLAGCGDNGPFSKDGPLKRTKFADLLSTDKKGRDAPAEDTIVPPGLGKSQVVEAPDVFDVTASALWDGRPSLGKVWVAYKGADPTNVIIRNTKTGASVRGALFRRERFFPGPPFQLSSDAAAALGILAGQPTEIHVTALKDVAAPPPAVVPAPDAATADAGGNAAAKTTESTAAATAGGTGAATAAGDGASIAAATAAAIAASGPAKDGGAAADAAPKAAPRRPVTEGPNAPQPQLNPVPEAPPAPAPGDTAAPVAAPSAIDSTAIAAPAASGASAAAAAAAGTATGAGNGAAATTGTGTGSAALARPFIQVGLYSQPDNATRAVEDLAKSGIIATSEPAKISGRDFTRVIVGPATTEADRAALLKQIRGLGYKDAYYVKG